MHDCIAYQVLQHAAESIKLLSIDFNMRSLQREMDLAACLTGHLPDQMPQYKASKVRNERAIAQLNENRQGSLLDFIEDFCNWQRIEEFRQIAFESRAADIAQALMGSHQVRLFHDHVLVKEPGTRQPTPWHQDQVYWPLETDDTVTMWMPLVRVPAEVGGMDFVDETWTRRNLSDLVIGDSSHAHFADLIRRNGWSTSTYGPFEPGDATFHRGWTLHSAPANETDQMRSVITVIYYADGTKIGADDHPARQLDLALWLGGAKPGELADRNPLLWHESWSG